MKGLGQMLWYMKVTQKGWQCEQSATEAVATSNVMTDVSKVKNAVHWEFPPVREGEKC